MDEAGMLKRPGQGEDFESCEAPTKKFKSDSSTESEEVDDHGKPKFVEPELTIDEEDDDDVPDSYKETEYQKMESPKIEESNIVGIEEMEVGDGKPKSVEPKLSVEAEGTGKESQDGNMKLQKDEEDADDIHKNAANALAEAENSKNGYNRNEEEVELENDGHSEDSSKPDGKKSPTNPVPVSKFAIDSSLLPFPERLMALLDGNMVKDSMWWLPDGDAFCLIPVVFADRVLDRFFQGTKFESFTRKLNRWGFKRVAGQKVPANTIAYYNKNFIRGKPELLKRMNGGKSKQFISAREKRARAQIKRERDREKELQQAMYTARLQLGGNAGLGGATAGAGGLLGQPSLDQSNQSFQSFLASRQFALQQANELSVAQQMLAAKQALAEQQLQMRFLQGGAAGMQEPNLLSSNMLMQNPAFGGGSLAGLSPLRGSVPNGMFPLGSDMVLASHMTGMPQNDLVGLMMAQQRMGAAAGAGLPPTESSAESMKKLLAREDEMKAKMMMASSVFGQSPAASPAQKPADSSQLDPRTFEPYMGGQHRNGDM